jgi:hypothetical protein
MHYRYYLGEINNETLLFNKNINSERWESLKCNKTKLNSYSKLQYFTIDRCFIKNKSNGKITTENYGKIELIDKNILKVQVETKELPFFPTQYNYFNKQIHTIEDYLDKSGNIITFSNYIENGIHYYEIYSSSSISSSSL